MIQKILLTKSTKKQRKLSKGTRVEDQAFEPPHPSSENSQTAKDIPSDSNLDSNHKNVFDLPENMAEIESTANSLVEHKKMNMLLKMFRKKHLLAQF